MVDCLTDNVNRSASDVKSAITKGGGKPAESGSVLFNFSRLGCILVEGAEEEALFEAVMEAGGEDMSPVPETPGTYKVSH